MQIYKGNLEIKEGDITDYSELEEITGNLSIYSSADLKALKTVGGDLSINSSADLKALKTVGGNLSINSSADLKALKTVGGNLYIYSSADLKAPALKTVGGNLSINSSADLKALKTVGGNLSINSSADLKALKTVGGYLYIYSSISKKEAKHIYSCFDHTKNKLIVSNLAPEFLIEKADQFFIQNQYFIREWFDKIRKDQLTPEEIFSIDNSEHRRIAYEMMDKTKMKSLKDFATIDEIKDDGYGYPMRLVSFKTAMGELTYLNCFCPTTGREYYLQSDKATSCLQAKNASFGLPADTKWSAEY